MDSWGVIFCSFRWTLKRLLSSKRFHRRFHLIFTVTSRFGFLILQMGDSDRGSEALWPRPPSPQGPAARPHCLCARTRRWLWRVYCYDPPATRPALCLVASVTTHQCTCLKWQVSRHKVSNWKLDSVWSSPSSAFLLVSFCWESAVGPHWSHSDFRALAAPNPTSLNAAILSVGCNWAITNFLHFLLDWLQ